MTRIRVPGIADPELEIERPVRPAHGTDARPMPKDLRPEDPRLDAAGGEVRTGLCLQLQRTLGNGELQRRLEGPARDDTAGRHRAAQRGIAGPAVPLPHLEQIQRSFGRHDVSGIEAHLDPGAAAAAAGLGAEAFTFGERIAFGGAPSVHTAAHEAAHVVQQRLGIQLEGGAGTAGDRYERHADQVADRVVQGVSSETLLDAYSPPVAHPEGVAGPVLQRKEVDLGLRPGRLQQILEGRESEASLTELPPLPATRPERRNYLRDLFEGIPRFRSLSKTLQDAFVDTASDQVEQAIDQAGGALPSPEIVTPVLQAAKKALGEGETAPKAKAGTRPAPGPKPLPDTIIPLLNLRFDENALFERLRKLFRRR